MTGSILFVTNNSPLPMISGDRIRNFNLMQELSRRGWRVSLFGLAFNEELPDPADRDALVSLCERVVIAPVRVSPQVHRARILAGVLRGRAFQTTYFWDARAAGRLREWLAAESFDVISVAQLYMSRYLPRHLLARAVLDSHNAEIRRVGSMAARGLTPRAVIARVQLDAVRRLEADVVRSVACTFAVSEIERSYFERLAPGRTALIPNGVDTDLYQARTVVEPAPRLLFMGTMTYSANVDAVNHLVGDILPRVQQRDATVTLVGDRPPRAVYAAARGAPLPVEVTGYVDSVRPYVERSRILVVPLRLGGGTRLKILEALAQGLPVVSTSIGCEGLGLSHEREIIIADDPAAFARWIDRLLVDDELCARLACEGRRAVEERFAWSSIGRDLDTALARIAPAAVV